MNNYFLLITTLEGTDIYLIEEQDNNAIKLCHILNDDIVSVLNLLIKEKEIYHIKILNNKFINGVINQINTITGIEIEVIENL